MTIEFTPFPKLPRLLKGEWVVTEKLDGTNACVQVVPLGDVLPSGAILSPGEDALVMAKAFAPKATYVTVGDVTYAVVAQSRNRLIYPGDDNYGFAAWVEENAAGLAATLGPGAHFGEWWGQGIQRRYGLTERRFSLFNVGRWGEVLGVYRDWSPVPGLRVVPLLATIPAHATFLLDEITDELKRNGSVAAAGFMDPEGVVVFDTGTRSMGKWTFDGDQPKWIKEQGVGR